MVIYVVSFMLVCILGVLFLKITSHKNLFLFSSFSLMAFVLGLRSSSVGEDTKMYLHIANATNQISWFDIIKGFPKSTWSVGNFGYSDRVETGYLLFNKLIMSVTQNAQWVLIISALIICFGIAKFIHDNATDVFMATYIFMCESIYMNAFNLARQCIAMAIAINAFTYMKKNKYISTIILILVASLFQQSALIYILVLPLTKINNKRRSIKFIVIGSMLIPFLAPAFTTIVVHFSPYYATYLQTSFWTGSARGTYIIWALEIVLGIYIYVCSGRRINKTEYTNVLKGDYEILSYIIIYLGIEALGLQFTAVSRVALYLRIFLILYFPIALRFMKYRTRLFGNLMIYGITLFEFISYASSDARIYSFFWQH